MLASGSLERRRPSKTLLFLILAIIAGVIPAALTNEGLPHATRALGAWLFLQILTGYCLAWLATQWSPAFLMSACVGAVFAGVFLNAYFLIYAPRLSLDAFSADIKMDAERCRGEKDWVRLAKRYPEAPITVRYYLMRFDQQTCESSKMTYVRLLASK